MLDNIEVYAVEDYNSIPYSLLRQVVILHWWVNDGSSWDDDDKESINKGIDFMRKSPFGSVSFYVLAKTKDDKIIGFAQYTVYSIT